MKNIFALSTIAMLFSLTGCGVINNCDLSALKIKSILIEGDEGGFVARAVRSELYQYGASVDKKAGVELVGSLVLWPSGSPSELSIEVSSMAFAAVVEADNPLLDKGVHSRQIARRVAVEFCRCSAAKTKE